MLAFALAAIDLIVVAVKGYKPKSFFNRPEFGIWSSASFYLLLILGINLELGLKTFQGSETSLMGYFVAGLFFLFVGARLGFSRKAGAPAKVAPALAALAFALGFDVLHPDDYSYVPAAFVALLVAFVAWRAYARLAKGAKKKRATINLNLLLYVLAVALLVYSAVFKMIDRGWLLPWAYLASAGALSFATSQVWLGWEKVLKQKPITAWVREGVFNLGVLVMVVAAFFVYREFL